MSQLSQVSKEMRPEDKELIELNVEILSRNCSRRRRHWKIHLDYFNTCMNDLCQDYENASNLIGLENLRRTYQERLDALDENDSNNLAELVKLAQHLEEISQKIQDHETTVEGLDEHVRGLRQVPTTLVWVDVEDALKLLTVNELCDFYSEFAPYVRNANHPGLVQVDIDGDSDNDDDIEEEEDDDDVVDKVSDLTVDSPERVEYVGEPSPPRRWGHKPKPLYDDLSEEDTM